MLGPEYLQNLQEASTAVSLQTAGLAEQLEAAQLAGNTTAVSLLQQSLQTLQQVETALQGLLLTQTADHLNTVQQSLSSTLIGI